MPFVGEVSVALYWGTLYDQINVPLNNGQIVADATKTMTLTGQVVWQTTWLMQLRINIDNYEDIVGVQYAKITNTTPTGHGSHWYDVLDYRQVSQGCVELGLRYDTILTMPLAGIKTISGTLKRWTVDDDTLYSYINTVEPIDLADPLMITWQLIDPAVTGLMSWTKIAGFPFDMAQPPEIVTYENPDGEETNVYYPKLTDPGDKVTVFQSGRPGSPYPFNDGMSYYVWQPGNISYETYNKAMSLDIDMPVNGYILALSSWVEITSDSDSRITQIAGKSQNYAGTLPLYSTGVKNKKAGALNVTLTLSSPASGDSVTVNNFQLAGGNVNVFTDPYSTGGFRARFVSYLNDTNAAAGIVKSPSWQPLTITSGVGFGTASTAIENTMSADTLKLGAQQSRDQNALAMSQLNDRLGYDTAMGLAKNGINALASGLTGNVAGAANGVVNMALSAIDANFNYGQESARLTLASQQLDARTAQQAAILSYNGNAGRLAPPSVKYAMARDMSSLTYAFTVMRAGPSAKDVQRLDDFFTAYGYNVDGVMLTSPQQLQARQRFTFVQADDVRIMSTVYADDNERIGDEQTTLDIQRRFSAGLRIWRTTPDFDYVSDNPVREV